MNPTVFREKGYRFFFFSREESRMHVPIVCERGEAKFWLEPEVELAKSHGLSRAELREIRQLAEGRYDELEAAWKRHFAG